MTNILNSAMKWAMQQVKEDVIFINLILNNNTHQYIYVLSEMLKKLWDIRIETEISHSLQLFLYKGNYYFHLKDYKIHVIKNCPLFAIRIKGNKKMKKILFRHRGLENKSAKL